MLDDFKPAKQPKRQPISRAQPTAAAVPRPRTTAPPATTTTAAPIENDTPYRVPTKNHSKRKKILIATAILTLVAGIAGAAYWWTQRNTQPLTAAEAIVAKEAAAEEAKVYAPLTGKQVSDASLAKRPVTGLMVENSPEARPQSGLDKAGVVFEAIAEGGVTRFLALYQEDTPDYIGPIRSARPYYVEWAKMFDASYGHVGGSPDALALIKSLGVKDIDQFANGSSYSRVTEKSAPHNVYTDFSRLDALNQKKGYTSSKFTAWSRKVDVPQTPTASTIDLSVSGPLYSPRFTYDISSNTYKRTQNGQPHLVRAKDKKTTSQLSPKTVIALVTTYGIEADGVHSKYRTTGTGKMYVFQDGIVSIGTWSRADAKAGYVFKDKNGLPMLLNRGQTWVTLVGSESAVSYKP